MTHWIFRSFLLILLSSIFSMTSFAGSFWDSDLWHPVLGLESGVAFISHAGKSKTFPIEDPLTDEFYNYSPKKKTHDPLIYGGFLGAEWQGFKHFGIQFDAKYNQSSSFSVHGNLVQGVDAQSEDHYTYKYKIRIRQLLAEGKFQYVLKWFRPYFLLGLGAGFNVANHFSTNVPSSMAFTRMYKSNSCASFSYAVGAGMDFSLIRYLRLGVGYRFTDLGKVALGSANIDGTSVSGTLSQSHLYSNEILANLTIVF
ncbi:MAG: outer membrane beta-barrel protein [Chlamydiota bacterium]